MEKPLLPEINMDLETDLSRIVDESGQDRTLLLQKLRSYITRRDAHTYNHAAIKTRSVLANDVIKAAEIRAPQDEIYCQEPRCHYYMTNHCVLVGHYDGQE